jgi:hypothetical protein
MPSDLRSLPKGVNLGIFEERRGVMDSNDRPAVFVFDENASYGFVTDIRNNGVMPKPGMRYVAAVTGPWKIVKVVEFDDVRTLAAPLDAPGDGTATSFGMAKVRRSVYKDFTLFVRIETDVADPRDLLGDIANALEVDLDDLEADVVIGDFDILVCLVDDDETRLGPRVLSIRGIPGVRRTVTLRVIDYVSTSPNAPDDHRVEAA